MVPWPVSPAVVDQINMTELAKVINCAAYADISSYVPEEFPYFVDISELILAAQDKIIRMF